MKHKIFRFRHSTLISRPRQSCSSENHRLSFGTIRTRGSKQHLLTIELPATRLLPMRDQSRRGGTFLKAFLTGHLGRPYFQSATKSLSFAQALSPVKKSMQGENKASHLCLHEANKGLNGPFVQCVKASACCNGTPRETKPDTRLLVGESFE